MKKIIGIALVMVICLAGAASAAQNNWAMQIRAGDWNATTKSFTNSFNPVNCVVKVGGGTDSQTNSTGFTATQSGIYDVDAIVAGKLCTTKYYAYDAQATSYTFHLQLATGSNRPTTVPIGIAWQITGSAYALAGTTWTVDLYRGSTKVATYVDDGIYATNKLAYTIEPSLAAGMTENWTLVATSVPEPGSILAMLSGLVGLAGYSIRRRK